MRLPTARMAKNRGTARKKALAEEAFSRLIRTPTKGMKVIRAVKAAQGEPTGVQRGVLRKARVGERVAKIRGAKPVDQKRVAIERRERETIYIVDKEERWEGERRRFLARGSTIRRR